MTEPTESAVTEAAAAALVGWLRSIATAVLCCAVTILLLVCLIAYGLWRVSQTVSDQGKVLESQTALLAGQERAQAVSACAQGYTATFRAWTAEALEADQHADNLFAQALLVGRASDDDPRIDAILAEYEMTTAVAERAASRAEEMTRRSLGLSELSGPGKRFTCPPIPAYLAVDPIDLSELVDP